MNKLIEKYYINQKLNCAETILLMANEEYNLELSNESISLIKGFGGGMSKELVCGAITGGIATLSYIFNKNNFLKEAIIEFLDNCQDKFQSVDCSKIKPNFRKEDIGCHNTIDITYKTLKEIIDKYKKEN